MQNCFWKPFFEKKCFQTFPNIFVDWFLGADLCVCHCWCCGEHTGSPLRPHQFCPYIYEVIGNFLLPLRPLCPLCPLRLIFFCPAGLFRRTDNNVRPIFALSSCILVRSGESKRGIHKKTTRELLFHRASALEGIFRLIFSGGKTPFQGV